MPTVTAIIGAEMRYADSEDGVTELVTAVFAEPRSGWAARLFTWRDGVRSRHGGGDVTVDQMRVAADLRHGWGALNLLRHDPGRPGWEGWDSFNPELPAAAPELPFGSGRLLFPQSASLPLETVIAAVHDYCHSGQRPPSVKWQDARNF